MRPTYGILDLFALVSKLLAPFVDPLRAEFAVKAIDRPRPTPPQPAPQPAPEPATPIVIVPPAADTLPVHVVVSFSPAAVDFTTSAGISADPGPLFVRKRTGKQWRYHVAQADAPGPKFRRLSAGRRVRYEPAASL